MVTINIIIPVYNGEKYLHRCLESIKQQSFYNWRAICVDDGSSDKSGKILDEYAARDKRFIVVHKKNGGVSSARNEGIKHAIDGYIHFMDADDVIDTDYYKKMISYNNKFESDIICSGFISNSKHSSSLTYKRCHNLKTLFGKLFWTQALTKSFVWRYLYKTDFIKKNKLKFDVSLISQEDALFVLNSFVKSNNVTIAPDVNYHYLFNENSVLNNKQHYDKLKQQYKIGKTFRKKFAVTNNVVVLWYFRKIISVLLMG